MSFGQPLRRLLAVAGIVGLALGAAACGDDDGGGGNNTNGNLQDPFGFDLSDVRVELPDLDVVVEADRTLVAPDDTVTALARVTVGDPSAVSWSWRLPEGAELVDGAEEEDSVSVSFSEPGEYDLLVEVRAGDATALGGLHVVVADPEQNVLIGDVDGNGSVGIEDAEAVSAFLNGAREFDATQFEAADVNLNGYVDGEDLELIEGAAGMGWNAPAYLDTVEAVAGQPVFVIHPLLLDPASRVAVKIESVREGSWSEPCLANMRDKPHWDEVVSNRFRPGYLSFAVPIKYACLSSPEMARVVLETDAGSRVVLTENFLVRPLPPASEEPGAKVLETMGRLRMLYASLEETLEPYVEEIGASDDDRATLLGLARAASEAFDEVYGRFYVAFQKLDAPTKRAWERLALGMGLEEQLQAIQTLQQDLQTLRERKDLTGSMLKLICTFNTIKDVSDKVAEINEAVTGALEYVDWWPVNKAPVVGPVISFLSALTKIVDIVTGVIDKIAEYVPKVGEKIVVTVAPKLLRVGESATVSAGLPILLASGLCKKVGGQVAESITDSITDFVTKQIAKRIPYAGRYFKRHDFDPEEMNWVMGKIYDAIGWLAGKLVDALGIGDYLENLVDTVCGAFQDPMVPVPTSEIHSTCGTLDDAGKWTCTRQCGGANEPANVGFAVEHEFCVGKRKGSGSVGCIGTVCGDGQVDPPEECESNSQCDAGQVCHPGLCRCMPQNECGNGVVEQGEECEKDADCNSGEVCTNCACGLAVETCQSDDDCRDDDPNDCLEPYCDQNLGACRDRPVPFLRACNTHPCLENQLCDAAGRCVGGAPKVCDNPPEDLLAQCIGPGVCREQGGQAICDYPAKEGAECRQDEDCNPGQTCNPDTCACEGGGGGPCRCNENGQPEPPGTTFEVVSGCEGWPDATECSGWHSVTSENGQDPTGWYTSGTEFTAFDCTIRIVCPSSSQ